MQIFAFALVSTSLNLYMLSKLHGPFAFDKWLVLSHMLNGGMLLHGPFAFDKWLVQNRSILDGQRVLQLKRYNGYILRSIKM